MPSWCGHGNTGRGQRMMRWLLSSRDFMMALQGGNLERLKL